MWSLHDLSNGWWVTSPRTTHTQKHTPFLFCSFHVPSTPSPRPSSNLPRPVHPSLVTNLSTTLSPPPPSSRTSGCALQSISSCSVMTAAVAWWGSFAFKSVLLPAKKKSPDGMPPVYSPLGGIDGRPAYVHLSPCFYIYSIWSVSEPAGRRSRISLGGDNSNGKLL